MPNSTTKYTYYTYKTKTNNSSKNYQIKSQVVEDDEFDKRLDELMNQELVYGDINYY